MGRLQERDGKGTKIQSNVSFWDTEYSFFFFFSYFNFNLFTKRAFSVEKKVVGEQEKENSIFQGLLILFWGVRICLE